MLLKNIVVLGPALGLLLFNSGCRTSEPRDASPQELNAFLEGTKDPRLYGMHSYPQKREVRLSNSNRAHDFGKEIIKFTKTKGSLAPPIFALYDEDFPSLKALYDSTTPHTWVDLDTANKLGLVPLGKPTAYTTASYHTAEKITGHTAMCGKFHLRSIQIESPIFQVIAKHHSLGPVSRDLENPRPHMVIGNDLLGNFSTVQINFTGQWIQFGPGIQFKPDPTHLVASEALQRFKGALAIKAEIGTYKGYCIIDTVGNYGIAMKNPARETLPFRLGDWTKENVAVTAFADHNIPADSLPRIGRKLLQDCRMTLDFRKNKVYFEKNPSSDH